MVAIVRLALRRPYTFVVLAILILIFGALAALRTATDIFPDIKIPVIAVVWTYRGMSPDDMAGRVIYYYERQLSSSVNDIEHIESQSLTGIGIVKIFFQPGVDIRTATAQVTSLSQTVLKQLPPGITPPLILNYNASTVPILQLALSSFFRSRNFSTWDRTSSGRPLPQSRERPFLRPMAARSGRSRSISTRRSCRPIRSRRRTSKTRSPPRTRSSQPAPPRSGSSNTMCG
jgi:AcrB/AcrD/AcrF family